MGAGLVVVLVVRHLFTALKVAQWLSSLHVVEFGLLILSAGSLEEKLLVCRCGLFVGAGEINRWYSIRGELKWLVGDFTDRIDD